MDDVKVPEETGLVTYTVEPVVREIVDKEKNHPGPPRIGWELEWRKLVRECVNSADEKSEHRPERNAYETDQDICPRILRFVIAAITSARQPCKANRSRRESDLRANYENYLLWNDAGVFSRSVFYCNADQSAEEKRGG